MPVLTPSGTPGYSYITYAQLQTQVSARLDDPSNIFWSVAEVQLLILEALRTWQAFAHYWRDRMTFDTLYGVVFYDLTQQPGTLVPFTVKDADLTSLILYHLIEPQLSGPNYVGTDMFSLDDFTKALERRRNLFLFETGMVTSRLVQNWPPPPVPRGTLDDRTMDVRRVAWFDATGTPTVLYRSEEWAASAFQHGWEDSPSPTPLAYSVAAEPPVTLQMIPPPQNNGQAEILAVLAGNPLNPAFGVLIGIPDDFTWAVKWGAIADLLAKSGQAHDMFRAKYCEQRYQEGVALAKIHTSAVQGFINGQQNQIQSLNSFDTYNPSWQAQIVGAPTDILLQSWNMLAVSGPPDAGPYSVMLDIVKNAPLPVNPGDFVQIGREELDPLLDYIEHMAWFKIGGNEFIETVPLYANFQRAAAVYNEKLKATINSLEPMGDRAQREEVLQPRRTQEA